MAAVLACGPEALLSHRSAAELWGIRVRHATQIEISVSVHVTRSVPAIRLHRRRSLRSSDRSLRRGIPLTSPIRTLVDLAACVPQAQLEVAVNEADKRNLVDPEQLRSALETMKGQRGVACLRRLLDRRTFRLTDSELERRFLPIARAAGLPVPETRRKLNGFRVDFFWPDLGLVVETDGLRYHRTPAQQTRDRLRDQAHAAAGLTALRFTHAQVRFERSHVRDTLRAVALRLLRAAP